MKNNSLIKKIKVIIKKIFLKLKYGNKVVFFSIGENCLSDSLLNRNNIKSFSSPYSSGRTNIEYILYFENNKFNDLLNTDYLYNESYLGKNVIRNKKLKKLRNNYHNSVINGFEFTHHDVINNKKIRKAIYKRCNRLLHLKNKKIYMLYYHRLCNNTNETMLLEDLKKLREIYIKRNNDVNIYYFTQVIVSNKNERKMEKYDLENGIYKYVFYTLNEWEGTDFNIFYGICDDDLLGEMINDIKKSLIKK